MAVTERESKERFQRAAVGVRRQCGVEFLWLLSRSFEHLLGRHAGAALEAHGFFEREGRYAQFEWYRG